MPGPLYFAWVDPSTAFNPTVHNVEDESIVSFRVRHAENDFASLTLIVRNPKIGLLATGRKVWAWLSYDFGSGPEALFFGRLIGIPNSIFQEVVTLQFIARPLDFQEQKDALAATLRDLPYYDPVFVDETRRLDPDVVLEARTELWHIDRLTHELTLSDILSGEDGLETFTSAQHLYDNLQLQLGEPPLRAVYVDGSVSWDQVYSAGGLSVFEDKPFDVPTKALATAWPKSGASLGGGWFVEVGSARTSVDNVKEVTTQGSYRSEDGNQTGSQSSTEPTPFPAPAIRIVSEAKTSMTVAFKKGDTASSSAEAKGIILASPIKVYGTLRLRYEANRKRLEHSVFTVYANVQAIVTLPEDTEVEYLGINGVDVSQNVVVGDDATKPLPFPEQATYFATARGRQSIEYLLLRARARLASRARTVQVTAGITMARAADLSCRKSATIEDDRIPGGTATGKVIAYEFGVDGPAGRLDGVVTIACAIGYGDTITTATGTPDYVNAGYVDQPYQSVTGEVVAVGVGDLGYTPPVAVNGDDGLRFPLSVYSAFNEFPHVAYEGSLPNLKKLFKWLPTSWTSQGKTVTDTTATGNLVEQIEELYKAHKTKLVMKLYPVAGSQFETGYTLDVTPLELPKGIDLEAGA